LMNRETGVLEPLACRGLSEVEWRAQDSRSVGGRAKKVIDTKACLIVRNVQTDPQTSNPEIFRKYGLVSYLAVPLLAKSEAIGVLGVYTKEEHEFGDEDAEFLNTLAGQAAIAIHNSQFYEEMAKLAGDLAKSNRVKDEFLSVMSHELRTPLNVVMGYAAMIKDGLLGEINTEQEKAAEKIITRAKDQLIMISEILQVTQIEAEGIKLMSHEFSLEAFLNDLRSTYDVSMDKEITLTWDYHSDLPVIKTDGEKLKHILQNLINNAIKFTGQGHVTISAGLNRRSRQQPESNGQVEFKVEDTGIGIPEEALPIIFERFRQLDSSETRNHGGVGMGLYIVKKYTEVLGGSVQVESEPGKGSTFTVTIPLTATQQQESADALV
ncbi:MAG: GAF domain-containing sensor histidine kinase, partial [Deltaproteobacteria bacterium]|nr:GAF domain-containing sensor histidine kinase [Deltaproteobacteria bacterium]